MPSWLVEPLEQFVVAFFCAKLYWSCSIGICFYELGVFIFLYFGNHHLRNRSDYIDIPSTQHRSSKGSRRPTKARKPRSSDIILFLFCSRGEFFAVKEVSLLDSGSQNIIQLQQEIALLSQLRHENIVRYLGTDTDNDKLCIFLELVTKGSLAKLYQKYKLRDSQVSTYTRQILSGLNYLHEQNVVHRDIKCANILVDASGSVKLADFGLAKATTLSGIKSCKGSPYWMAPEVIHSSSNKGYGLAADIWSLGCTVLEMLTRKNPYFPLEGVAAMFRIATGKLPSIPDTLSTEARDFILKCLQFNPNDRPTAAQLLDHPFIMRRSF